MTSTTLHRALCAGLFVITATLGLTGCGMSPGGDVGENLEVLATCPADDQKVASLVLPDGTTSGRTDETDALYLKTIEEIARRTTICGGRLTVAAFSSSSGSTVEIYDGEIKLEGATDIANMRKVDDEVESIMEEISADYESAMSSVPEGGTDIVGLYRLFGEQAQQLPDYQLEVTVLTDGLNNLGVNTEREMSTEEATALADSVNVPTLPTNSSITVAGIGRTADGALPSPVISGLVTFYTRLCDNTGAETCLAVTDWR
jgi:hypothetical protein